MAASTTGHKEASREVGHDPYLLKMDQPLVNGADPTDQSDLSDLSDQPRYLSQLERARAANFCLNGDAFFPARKIVYNPRQFRDFGQYLDYLTDKLAPSFGAVRKICTPRHGHRIRELRDLQDNGIYVAAGKERFKPYQYEHMAQDRRRPPLVNSQPEQLPSRQYVTSGRIKKIETQSILIKVWPNGGDLTGPRRVLLTPRVRPFTLSNVVLQVNEVLKADCLGTVERLYFLTGSQVSDTDQITHNGQYVACKRHERFKRAHYTEHGTKNLSTSPRPQRRLLAPLAHRTGQPGSQSSPEQSSNSTQSSLGGNSYRRTGRWDEKVKDDRVGPLRPLRSEVGSDRVSDYPSETGPIGAKHQHPVTQRAQPVQDGGDHRTWPPDYKNVNGFQDYQRHNDPQPRLADGPRPPHKPGPLKHPDKRADSTSSIDHPKNNQHTREPRVSKPPLVHAQRPPKKSPSMEKLQFEDDAATKIQAAYRGYHTRNPEAPTSSAKTNSKRISPDDERLDVVDGAATRIQAAYRGYHTRKENESKLKEGTTKSSPSSERRGEESVAATKIQAAYRGYSTRKNSNFSNSNSQIKNANNNKQDERNQDGDDVNAAAAKIQAGYRGYSTRKQAADQQKAAAKIQAGYRGYQTRKEVSDQHASATKIQSSFRGHLARKQRNPAQEVPEPGAGTDEQEAATRIQAGYRGYLARKAGPGVGRPLARQDSYDGLDRENQAAVTIQSHYRGYTTRKSQNKKETSDSGGKGAA